MHLGIEDYLTPPGLLWEGPSFQGFHPGYHIATPLGLKSRSFKRIGQIYTFGIEDYLAPTGL